MRFRILFIFILINSIFAKEYKISDIINSYSEIFEYNITRDSAGISTKIVISDSLSKNHFLYKYLMKNKNMVGYFLDNLPGYKITNFDMPDSVLKDEFFISLEKDSLFNYYFIDLTARYLKRKKRNIIDYVPSPKPQTTYDDAMTTMAKFGYIHQVENGRVMVHVCSGINGFNKKDFQNRNVMLEALCFSSIFKSRIRMFRVMIRTIKAFSSIKEKYRDADGKLTVSPEVRQEMYGILENDKYLKKILKKEYRKRRKYLSFEIE